MFSGGEVSAVPCKPRDTLVPLPLNASGETVFQPDVALVKRCGGYCGIAVRCVPTKTRLVKRRVGTLFIFLSHIFSLFQLLLSSPRIIWYFPLVISDTWAFYYYLILFSQLLITWFIIHWVSRILHTYNQEKQNLPYILMLIFLTRPLA